ncbi:BspA family leucine-rich repeat surface protein [Mycoplasma phocoeninasale]|uniref:BspA family leucine-rich repeat surface protein n=1 Tax=Mycoplasma phocoeninasale TaxID=2726117 RepID=UPI001968899A|nr:BspA family leucine-rich repeat surface protein [Mycoplasma phocoeninasale]
MKKKGAMRKKILRKIFMTSLCLIPIIPVYAGINFSKLANTNFNLSKENNIILNSNKITKESKIAKIKAKYKSLGYELILHKKGEYVNYYYGLVCTRIGFMYFKNPANRFEVPLVVLEPFDENVVSFHQSFSNNIVRQAISGDFVVSMENAFEGCVWFNEYIDHWEVSDVINMSCMFKNAIKFNEKLTTWNVKKVIDMSSMFEGATLFNGDITPWKTESAMTMSSMFKDAWNFDQSLYYWDTSNVRDMSSMFEGAKKFNNYVYSWDVSKVRNMSSMFKDAVSFNDSIGNWITSNVTTMSKMFEGAREFNRSLYYWNTSNVNNMSSMFKGAKKFNNYVYSWDVSNVTNMSSMFEEAEEFNDDVYLWNFSNVINMSSMFKNAKKFNKWRSFQDFNLRDTSHTFKNVRDMSSMFEGAVEFNRDISMWDISNVRNMSSMFKNAKKFNNYGRSPFDALKYENNIKNMSSMFEGAESFNLDISRWNTSNVENMTKMFKNAKIFDANLSNWKVDSVKNYDEFCDGTLITFEKYPKGLTKDINKLNIKNDKKHSKIPYFSEDNYHEIVEFVKNNNKHINWNDFKFRFSKFSKEWMKIVITPSDTGKWKYRGELNLTVEFKREIRNSIKNDYLGKLSDNQVNNLEEITKKFVLNQLSVDKINYQYEHQQNNKKIILNFNNNDDYEDCTFEIRYEIKRPLSELITSSSFDKVNNLDEENIKRVLKIKHSNLDFDHLDLVINDNKVIIKAKDSYPDYQGQKEISIEVKKQISELITSSSFDKVNNLDEENIKRVLKIKHSNLDFDHLDLVINDNYKVIIKAKDSYPDYQGQKEISIEVKKQISELITSESFDKVNNLDESSIKKVILLKHPSLDFNHLELVISADKVVIRTKSSHPDYQGEIEVAVVVKRPLSELITSPKFNKVAKIEVEEIKKVIREKFPKIDFAHLDVEIAGNKVTIKAKDSHPDYQGQKEIIIEVKKQISKLITTESFDKVNNLDEENIKRVLKIKHSNLDFEHLELVISGNKVVIKAKDSHPDYQGQKEIAIAAKRPLSELITSPKFNKVAKIEVEEIKKVIREKFPEIDFAHLDIEITGNKVTIKAKDSHPDYQGEIEVAIEAKKHITQITKNVDMNLKLDKVGHKEINEEKIKILIMDIFYKLNIIDIEFKLHIDKKNSKVFVDFDNDNNYYGKLLFNYEFNNSTTIKNKRIVKWIIITVAISLILFITLIVLVKNRKKLKIKNRQNK